MKPTMSVFSSLGLCRQRPSGPSVLRIVSGGQTGVDQAALDVARILGIPTGGYVPSGRWTAKNPLPTDYVGMEEVGSSGNGDTQDVLKRTWMNVEIAHFTMIIEYSGVPSDKGTCYTRRLAKEKDQRKIQPAADSGHLPICEPTLIELQIDRENVLNNAKLIRQSIEERFWDFSRKNLRCGDDYFPTIVLNIAGPRQAEGASDKDTVSIYDDARKLLLEILENERRNFIVSQADRAMLIEQAMESLRHWDTIRWLSPFFFFTLAGGAIFGLSSLEDDAVFKLSDISFQIICGALFTAGYLSLFLINRTVSYHKDQARILVCLGIDRKSLPMVDFNWRRTATNQFRAVIFVTMLAVATAAIVGRSKTFEILGIAPVMNEVVDSSADDP
jgi:hypothetical protein